MARTPATAPARIKFTRTPARIDKLCVRMSVCQDVYGGHEHYCVQEGSDGKPGFVVADIEHTHSNDKEIATLFAAAPDYDNAAKAMMAALQSIREKQPALWEKMVTPELAHACFYLEAALKKAKGN